MAILLKPWESHLANQVETGQFGAKHEEIQQETNTVSHPRRRAQRRQPPPRRGVRHETAAHHVAMEARHNLVWNTVQSQRTALEARFGALRLHAIADSENHIVNWFGRHRSDERCTCHQHWAV